MGPGGEALAAVDGRTLEVPYAAPGDEATVRLTAVESDRLRGQIVVLKRTSPHLTRPRCPHFGRCGGCQWQHLDYPAQLEQKTLLVRDALALAGLGQVRVDPAVGWEPPWEFRTALDAAVSTRNGRPVLGFFTWGGERVVDIKSCPVQHPGNVAALTAVRAAWDALAPVMEADVPLGTPGSLAATVTPSSGAAARFRLRSRSRRVIGRGTLRGVMARVGAATGEVMLGLKVSEPLTIEGRSAVVRALLDRVPGLISIMQMRVPRTIALLRGRRPSLLWGRPYIRDEIAGVRYHIPVLAEFPINARALPGVIELVLGQLDIASGDNVIETDAGVGAYTLHLALAAGRVMGITDENLLDAAWGNARLNRLGNCLFYTRDPIKALEKLKRYGPVHHAFLHPPGEGLPAGLPRGLRGGGITRIVYLGRTLGAVNRDTQALAKVGYRIVRVQPLDVSPHTSRLAVLVTAVV
jgi:23S rRNA (uracil1939-C5)-methyltransferase